MNLKIRIVASILKGEIDESLPTIELGVEALKLASYCNSMLQSS